MSIQPPTDDQLQEHDRQMKAERRSIKHDVSDLETEIHGETIAQVLLNKYPEYDTFLLNHFG